MAITTQGYNLSTDQVKQLIINGGDYSAAMVEGTDIFPATRGLHMLAAYAAPLERYYTQWPGRVHLALSEWVSCVRDSQPTGCQYVKSDMARVRISDEPLASMGASMSIGQLSAEHGSQPLKLHDRRHELELALLHVDTASQAAKMGEERWEADTADLHSHGVAMTGLYLGRSIGSAGTLANAINFSNSAYSIRQAERGLTRGQARFEAEQSVESATRKRAKDQAAGQIVGAVFGSIF